MEQTYVNDSDNNYETVFLFPTECDYALSKITIDFHLSDGTKKSIETEIDSR